MNFVRNKVILRGFLSKCHIKNVLFSVRIGFFFLNKNVSFTICKLRTGEYRKRIGQWETDMQSSFSNRCNPGRQWFKIIENLSPRMLTGSSGFWNHWKRCWQLHQLVSWLLCFSSLHNFIPKLDLLRCRNNLSWPKYIIDPGHGGWLYRTDRPNKHHLNI